MKNWYSIKAQADGSAEISIFDEIGAWGVTAKDFIADLKKFVGKAITVSINSPGGSVFDALAMYNALRAHGSQITTKTMGVAASAASVIFMAGDKRQMPENTFLMLHNPLTFAYGNAAEIRDMADVLDKIAASLISLYTARSGKSEEEVKALLDAETWLNAADALDGGFATEVIAEMKVAASFDMDRLPANIKAIFEANSGEPGDDDVAAGGEEGETTATLADQISAAVVASGLGDQLGAFLLDEKITDMEQAKVAIAQAREVRALCVAAKKPEEAAKLIRARSSLAEARAHLCNILAAADEEIHTDGALPSNNSKPAKTAQPAALKTADIWAARRNIH